MSQWYELVVFTASMEIYGCAVADKLDNNRSILNRRYYRQVGGAWAGRAGLPGGRGEQGLVWGRGLSKCGWGLNTVGGA